MNQCFSRRLCRIMACCFAANLPCIVIAAERQVKIAMRDGVTIETYYKPMSLGKPFITIRPARRTSSCLLFVRRA